LITNVQMFSNADSFLNVPLEHGSGSYVSVGLQDGTTLGDILQDYRMYFIYGLLLVSITCFYFLLKDFLPWKKYNDLS